MNSDGNHNPSTAWWLYFALMLALVVLSLLSGPASPLDVVFGIVNAVALAGLWGYIRQVAVGSCMFWAGYFVLSVLLNLASLLVNIATAEGSGVPFAIIALSAALVLPLHIALWRYAFCSRAAWAQASVRP